MNKTVVDPCAASEEQDCPLFFMQNPNIPGSSGK